MKVLIPFIILFITNSITAQIQNGVKLTAPYNVVQEYKNPPILSTENSSMLLTEDGVYIVNYIASKFVYPDDALEQGITGKVIVEFIVEKDGFVSDIEIINKVCESCVEEVIRVIKSTKYKVTTQNGKSIRSRYRIPVSLILE